MIVMFKQSLKNMGYFYPMSDILKKQSLSFWRQRATLHNEHITNVLLSFPAWEHTVHIVFSPRKLVNVMEVSDRVFELWCTWMDNGSDKMVFGWRRMRSVLMLSFRVRSLFSNFFVHYKRIGNSNIEQVKKQTETKSKLQSSI